MKPEVNRWSRCLAVFLGMFAVWAGCCGTVSAAKKQLHQFSPAPASGIDVSVYTYYDSLPPAGSYPVYITIRNESGGTRTWTLSSKASPGWNEGDSYSYTTTLVVDHGQERSFEILIPLMNCSGMSYRHGFLVFTLDGYGMRGNPQARVSSDAYNDKSCVGMSSGLHADVWGIMEETLRGSSYYSASSGSKLDSKFLPSDWRGFSGFDGIFFRLGEWDNVSFLSKKAIADWVLQGGHFFMVVDRPVIDSFNSLSLPGYRSGSVEEQWDYGFGAVHVVNVSGTAPEVAAELVKRVQTLYRRPDLETNIARSYRIKGWGLGKLVGELDVNGTLFMVYVILFAGVVGPVNLWVFCRGGKRYRLFYTTPLLSLGATILIVLLILLQDGIGGHGYRLTGVLLVPDENKCLINQEQIARTGAILSSTFEMDSSVVIIPIHASMRRKHDESPEGRFIRRGDIYGGDWFSSRAVQSHFLRSFQPTRARIEFADSVPGSSNPVRILSTIPVLLDEVYLVDPRGGYWRCSEVHTGRKMNMLRCTQKDFHNWWRSSQVNAGSAMQELFGRIKPVPGRFYATSAGDAFTIETSDAVDWKQDMTIFAGNYTELEDR